MNRRTPDRVRELVVAWAKLYPQFGTVAALNLVKCVHWPTGSPSEPPKDLKIDVLLVGVQNDPIVGVEGIAATAATIINASAASKRVMWQGIGHGASVYSSCAVPPLIGYVTRQAAGDRHVLSRLRLRLPPDRPAFARKRAIPASPRRGRIVAGPTRRCTVRW